MYIETYLYGYKLYSLIYVCYDCPIDSKLCKMILIIDIVAFHLPKKSVCPF